jgi:hypothetical protein
MASKLSTPFFLTLVCPIAIRNRAGGRNSRVWNENEEKAANEVDTLQQQQWTRVYSTDLDYSILGRYFRIRPCQRIVSLDWAPTD